ncbi:MAG: hypothetical protein KDB96_08530, partial [Flavobacteriales bacterium]|nr:hypothetical protein [Flavobacteriales bacterium]
MAPRLLPRVLRLLLMALPFTVQAQLNGTYVIDGGGGGDYLTFTAAVTDLTTLGVSGPVLLEITDGTYDENLTLTAIPGSSAANTVTFRGQSMDSSMVTLRSTTAVRTITLSGADQVSFEHMTVENSSNVSGAECVRLSGTNDVSAWRNLRFIGGVNTGILVNCPGNAQATFQACAFTAGSSGISFLAPNGTSELIVEGCSFSGQTSYGISLTGALSVLQVRDSYLDMSAPGAQHAIQVYNHNAGFLVEGNRLVLTAATGISLLELYGVNAPSTDRGMIRNNELIATGGAHGIRFANSSSNVDIFHNSIRTATGYPLWGVGAGSGHRLINNILTGDGYALYRNNSGFFFLAASDNVIHSTSGTLYTFWNAVAADPATLQTLSGGLFQNTYDIDPLFTGPQDLHLLPGSPAAGVGNTTLGIVIDGDGEPRPQPAATAPDIGMDEMAGACVQLAGTYVIGPSATADFATFNAALSRMLLCGISGPVVFEVEDGTYTERLVLPPVTGTSATNTITFRGQSLDSTLVTLEEAGGANLTNNFLVRYDGMDHVSFEHMTFTRTGIGVYKRLVEFPSLTGEASLHPRFRHMRFLGNSGHSTSQIMIGDNAQDEERVEIEHCRFENGRSDLVWNANGTNERLFIRNSVFLGGLNTVVQLTGLRDSLVISDNEISGANPVLLELDDCDTDFLIVYNRLRASVNGTCLTLSNSAAPSGSAGKVLNNELISINGTGLFIAGTTDRAHIQHNSISSGGTFAIYDAGSGTDLRLENNAVIATRTTTAYVFYRTGSSTYAGTSNNFLHRQGGPGYGRWGGVTATGLSQLQTLSGEFTGCHDLDPMFVDNTNDLHLQPGSPCAGTGTLIASITDDHDGEVRPQPAATAPDIGMDETPGECLLLSGTYVIGPSLAADFPDFSSALIRMVLCGISGPVVFEVEDGTYTEQITLPNIPGNSNVNTITFRGQSLDSSLVTLTWPNGSALPTVRFAGTDRVSFEHLTISRSGSVSLPGMCVDWESSIADATTRSEHVFFRHCRFMTTSTHTTTVLVQCTAENDENNVVFEDSRFEGGYIGLHWQMDYSALTLEVRRCTFTGQRLRSIQLNNAGTGDPEVYIEGNDITGPINSSSIAVDIAHNANLLQIIGNRITASATNGTGLQLMVDGLIPSWQVVRNNMISCSGSARGIQLTGTVNGLGIHYNSVSTVSGYALNITANGSGNELIGNILRSNTGVALYRTGAFTFSQAHHDLLWSAGTNLAFWGGFHSDLPCLQAATGQFGSSISADPLFVDDFNDLHLQSNSTCTGQGIIIPGLLDDLDGDARSLPAASAPDLGADEINADCTLLAGTYVIGPSLGADFTTFSEAMDRIVGCGITGPVVFEVENGTYTEQLRIAPIKGSSIVNTVTFRGQALDSTAVILQWPSQASNVNDHLIEAAGGDHVRFEHMTLRRTGTLTYATVIRFSTICDDVRDLRFGHCELTNNGTSANTAALVYRLNSGSGATLRLEACRLLAGTYAVFWDSNGSADSLSMSNCVRTGGTLGIRIYDVAGPVNILDCHLTGTINSEAVLLSACTGPVSIERNHVDGGSGVLGTGIYITTCTPIAPARAVIANNHVNFAGRYGIRLGGDQQRIDMVFNSVHMSAPGAYAYFGAGNSVDMQVHNNVLSSAQGYAIYNTMSGLTMDRNCLFRALPGPFIFWNGMVYTTVSALNAGTGTNANSVIVDPLFFAPLTDLHTYSMDLNGSAMPFAGITTDIDGDPRDPATPDIGCDEFTPQLWNEQFDVCVSADPAVSDGSGRPIWIYRDRKVIARIQENGNMLGTINSEIYIHTGPVRQSGIGQYYMDRNWRIEPQNPITGAGVDVRLFYHANEFAALAAADPAVTITSDAGVSQYDGPNENCLLADNTA